MTHHITILNFIFVLLLSCQAVLAQFGDIPADVHWTQNIIKKEDRHFDFKTVAKGTRSEHRFVIKNPFVENIHISSVSSSCTCTTAYIEDNKDVLQTNETATIIAQLHTDRFDGRKNATITVVLDKPSPAAFQLDIRGEIRSDLSITPNWLRFDNAKFGEISERTVTIGYTGASANWKIMDFKSDNENLSAEIVDTQAKPGLITTKIKVKLGDKMPKGAFVSRLLLISNDDANRREIPIVVRGTVGKLISVSPQNVFLGFLQKGQLSPIKTVTVRGTAPFKIERLLCNNPAVQVDFQGKPEDPPRIFYSMPIRYVNPESGPGSMKDGKLDALVQIETDDPEAQPTFKVTAQLKTDD